MDKKTFSNLRRGDLIKHSIFNPDVYVVTGSYGGRVTAVKTIDVTNEKEWDLIGKAAFNLSLPPEG